MRKASVLLIILLVPVLTLAQSGMEDVIYFKNGGILRGQIIGNVDDESLKIKTAGRNVFVVRLDEVREIKREKIPASHYFKESGYVNYTGMAIIPGEGSTSVRFQMVNGYRFSPKFSAGLGIGFTTYNDPLNVIPVFLAMKYNFLESNTTPFIFFKIGYGFSILPDLNPDENLPIEEHQGGFMLNPGIGLHFATRDGPGWYLTAGYNTINAGFEQERWDGRIIETDLSYRRLLFGFGLTF